MGNGSLSEVAGLLATMEVRVRLLEDQEQQFAQAVAVSKDRAARKKLQNNLKEIQQEKEELMKQLERVTAQADFVRKKDGMYAGKRFWWDVPFQKAIQRDGFSLPAGFYTEQNYIDSEYADGLRLTQQPTQKSMLAMDLYKRSTEQYMLLYQNPNKPKFSLSKKMDIKYIYNMVSMSNAHATISHIKTGKSPVAMIWMQYGEQKKVLEAQKKQRLEAFDRKADSWERYWNNSSHTVAEHYARGELTTQEYLDMSFQRDMYRFNLGNEYDSKIAGMARTAEYITNQSMNNFDRTRKGAVETHEKLRYMPVAEVAYLDGEVMAIAVYKTPQEIVEVECRDKMSIHNLEGTIISEKVLMEKVPEYAPLFTFLVQNYARKMQPYSVLDEKPANASDESWRMWAEARWVYELSRGRNINE